MATLTEDVTVVIATHGRPEYLADTLASLERCDFPRERFSVLVVDNAGSTATRQVCESAQSALRLTYTVHANGGKNAALNHALTRAEGRLLAFTDDDVLVDRRWISSLWEGASRWPEHDVFGGRILPQWPAAPPEVVLRTKYRGVAYSILDPSVEEGVHPDFLPFGPNMAIRRSVFEDGLRFDPALGPHPNAYAMGDETDLLERLRASGRPPVFLPGSVVRHRIRRFQYSYRWLLARARKWGRSVAARGVRAEWDDGSPYPRVPRELYRNLVEFSLEAVGTSLLGRRATALERAMNAAVELGKIDYHRALLRGDVDALQPLPSPSSSASSRGEAR